MTPLFIVAYDPVTEDRAPVELALAAAEPTGARVVAVAVSPWQPSDGEAYTAATDAVRRLEDDFAVETRIVNDSSAPHALHELASEERAALIVVGSSTRNRVGRVLLGTTAERLLQGAPCAVARAPLGYSRAPVGTIAVAFADTAEGHAALTTAHALAFSFDARLRVIAAVHPSGGLDAAMASGLEPQRSVLLEGRRRVEVDEAVTLALQALPPGVEVSDEMHIDDPAEVLLAISRHIDLLVLGSRGYGPLRSVLLGGVSRRVVEGAECPVLVLPRGVDGLVATVDETEDP